MKWFRTWKLYFAFILICLCHLVATIGYSLAYFGELKEFSKDKTFWWNFLCVMTAHYGIMCLKVIIQNLIMLRTDTGPLQKELIIDHTKYIPILNVIGFINVHCWG